MRFNMAAILLVSALGVSSAGAQSTRQLAQTAPAQPNTPERTAATYGDWVLRCDQAAAGRVCEISQTIQAQLPNGQTAAVAQVAMGRLQKSEPLRVTVVIPPNVTLTAPVKFSPEDKDGAPTIDLSWQRCLAQGCFASATLNEDMLKRLRARTEPGRLQVKDGQNRDVNLAFSTRGFAAALAALPND